MTYIETRTLSASKLRALCIEHDWYTCGDNEEYEALFNRLHDAAGCPVNLTAQKLAEIAADIMLHSEISDYTITSVMFALNRACTVVFDEDHDSLAVPTSEWMQTTIRHDGRKTSRVITDAKLASLLAQCHFLRQGGEDVHLDHEHDRMYNTTAYVLTRTHGDKTVTTRFERM